MLNYAWLILVFPAIGFLINALIGKRLPRRAVAIIASAAVLASFLIAIALTVGVQSLPGEDKSIELLLWRWITIGDFRPDFALLIDPLSMFMALVVTGVGFIIHLFAAEYMKQDDEHHELDQTRYARFFAYTNLFILMMLLLVLANNYVLLYLGWEGVGLASYLLIGFWFHRPAAGNAAKKAFLVNRVGDFGLAMAIFWLFFLVGKQAGSLAFNDVFAAIGAASPAVIAALTGVALLFLLAATGKSAQIPLFVWLPDAMEGPTPVSALIHAATMVTAGIYLIARSNPIFIHAPAVMELTAWIGALTALLAGTIALVQTDLKRILAYSTISQLGFMFLGVGVGAISAALFHLMAHAFFKALLFLTAGSVMHATHGELDINRMGGLRHKLPTTYVQFLAGALALAGFPLLSGFWSKDTILFETFFASPALYVIGLVTAFITAFYTFRAVYRVFYGAPRDQHLYDHVHEQPKGMTGPLWVLVAASILGGLVGIPVALTELAGLEHGNLIAHWFEVVFGGAAHHEVSFLFELGLLALSGVIAIIGIYAAYARYVKDARWARAAQRLTVPVRPVLEHKYWVDEIYMTIIVNPLRAFAGFCARVVDGTLIDGAVNGVGRVTAFVGGGVARLQTGQLGIYALSVFLGVVGLLLFFLLMS